MTTSTEEQRTSGEIVRDDFAADFKDRMLEAFTKVEGGPLDGTDIVSRGTFDEVWKAWWDDFELPLASENSAEVRTPGRVTLALVCPECGEAAAASVRLHAVLTAEGAKRTLKVKGASVSVDHVHGQMPLGLGDEVGTEPAFDVGDIVGDDDLLPGETPDGVDNNPEGPNDGGDTHD